MFQWGDSPLKVELWCQVSDADNDVLFMFTYCMWVLKIWGSPSHYGSNVKTILRNDLEDLGYHRDLETFHNINRCPAIKSVGSPKGPG